MVYVLFLDYFDKVVIVFKSLCNSEVFYCIIIVLEDLMMFFLVLEFYLIFREKVIFIRWIKEGVVYKFYWVFIFFS